jgi:hypothetical protein
MIKLNISLKIQLIHNILKYDLLYPFSLIKTKYFLYNILTNQLDKIICDMHNLKKIIKIIIKNKYSINKYLSDKHFLKDVSIIKYNNITSFFNK